MKAGVPFHPIGVIVEHEEIEGLSKAANERKRKMVEVIGAVKGDERARGRQTVVRLLARRGHESLLKTLPEAKGAVHSQWWAQFRHFKQLRIFSHVLHRQLLHWKRARPRQKFEGARKTFVSLLSRYVCRKEVQCTHLSKLMTL